MGKWTRRAVIGAGGLLGGGLLLGVGGVTFAPNRLRYTPETNTDDFDQLTTWIKITPDNRVTAIVPHCEMGQGALTGCAMMLAEELEADWSRVDVEEAPPEEVFANGYMLRGFATEAGIQVPSWLERAIDFASFKAASLAGMQITGGSSSTRATGEFGMRVAGAAAKEMLLQAAAEKWSLPASELTASGSSVTHAKSGRSSTYGELASSAAALPPPEKPVLKSRDEFRLIGTSQRRSDIPSKVDGTATYGIDVDLPNLLHAAIRMAPVSGSTLTSVDKAPVMNMPGVRDVVQLENAVVVVADGYWQAEQAVRRLEPEFSDVPLARADSDSIFAAHDEALNGAGEYPEYPGAAQVVDARYQVPYLAHATMEPMCATARLADGRCEVWAGTQDPLNARRVAAEAAGIDAADVDYHNLQLGGGFGRRLPGNFDYVEQAVKVAKSVAPRPVKLIWSREQDMQHDYYRPAIVARMQGALDRDGLARAWFHRFTGAGFLDRAAATPIYTIADTVLEVVDEPANLPTGAWRSVAASQHGFFVESFVDELAHAGGSDPMEYRRVLLSGKPRHLAVLDRVASMAGWGRELPSGHGMGVAIVESFGSIAAEVAEVSVTSAGDIRVHRVDAAVDCGLAVNPNQATAQVEGGIIFGLSAALFQEITVRDGAVEQQSFPDYDMIRLASAPRVHVEFIDSDTHLGGLGEPGVPPIAPAVANAVFAATGERLRSLPLKLNRSRSA